jgi:hypothetical protein
MAIKTARFKIKGMNQDLAVSSFSPEFAYENFNLRVTATDNNTLLSLTNEKGNRLLNSTTSAPFGFTLGYAVIGDNLVLFTHEDLKPTPEHPNIDHIYRIYGISNTAYNVQELYSGILNFDMTHPIETLAWYENEEIQKVYWVDGLNKPRMINIIHSGTYTIVTSPETQFDFNRLLELNERIDIEAGVQG